MKTKELVEIIEGRLTGEVDIDTLEGPYVVKGTLPDKENIERLELGKDFKPLAQIRLNPEPKFEKLDTSYLNITGFSGSAYQLTEQEYTFIESLIK